MQGVVAGRVLGVFGRDVGGSKGAINRFYSTLLGRGPRGIRDVFASCVGGAVDVESAFIRGPAGRGFCRKLLLKVLKFGRG